MMMGQLMNLVPGQITGLLPMGLDILMVQMPGVARRVGLPGGARLLGCLREVMVQRLWQLHRVHHECG